MLVFKNPEESVSELPVEMFMANRLLRVVSQQRQIEDQGDPVEVDSEENGKKRMYGGFGDDVGIESVT